MTTATTDLLTIAEVQSFLKVSRATIYEMMATRGLPPPIKIGRSNRWHRFEVEAWIEAQPRASIHVRKKSPPCRDPHR